MRTKTSGMRKSILMAVMLSLFIGCSPKENIILEPIKLVDMVFIQSLDGCTENSFLEIRSETEVTDIKLSLFDVEAEQELLAPKYTRKEQKEYHYIFGLSFSFLQPGREYVLIAEVSADTGGDEDHVQSKTITFVPDLWIPFNVGITAIGAPEVPTEITVDRTQEHVVFDALVKGIVEISNTSGVVLEKNIGPRSDDDLVRVTLTLPKQDEPKEFGFTVWSIGRCDPSQRYKKTVKVTVN